MFRKITGAFLVAVSLSLCAPAVVFAADAEQVTQMIEELPEVEDLTENDVGAIKKAMEEYRSLSMSEKLGVENYGKLEKLYNQAKQNGMLDSEVPQSERDAQSVQQEQKSMETSSEVETGTMEYVFKIGEASPTTSIVVHYITDLTGDGMGDIPSRIVLTSPEGVTTPLSNGSSGLKDETMDIALTWEPNYMQLDVAFAIDGKWKITTSDPVTFRAMPYAGVRKDITPEDDKEKADAGVTQPEDEKGKKGGGNILTIIFLIGVLVFLAKKYFFKKPDSPNAAAKKKKEKPIQEDGIPKRMTDEEVAEQMRREYMEKKAREAEENEYDDGYEDLDEEQEDLDEPLEEYEEGDTGILRKEDVPTGQDQPEEEAVEDDDGSNEDDSPDYLADDAFDI